MKLVKISAMWCPSCIIVNKFWNKLVEKYTDVEFIEYDLDMDSEASEEFNPGDTLPVFILFNNNIEAKRVVGEKTYDEMCNIIGDVFGL